jgi:hypothetical protein
MKDSAPRRKVASWYCARRKGLKFTTIFWPQVAINVSNCVYGMSHFVNSSGNAIKNE